MKSEKIFEILSAFEEFESSKQSSDLNEFADWIKSKSFNKTTTTTKADVEHNSEIIYMMSRFNRYCKLYYKQILKDLKINTIDEFWILNYVFSAHLPTKTEVYDNTIIELPVGTKMVKRLIDFGLITEFADEHDRRIRRMEITEDGVKERNTIIDRIKSISGYLLGKLDIELKEDLLKAMNYLDGYHNQIYKETDLKYIFDNNN